MEDYQLNRLQMDISRRRCYGLVKLHPLSPVVLWNAWKLSSPRPHRENRNGAFSDAMTRIRALHLDRAILSAADAGVPILGICLGMQMLFQHSEENGFYDGLGLFPGTITKFRDAGLKIPHMGWNTLDTRPCVLFDGGQSPFVYFVHSYCMADVSPEWTTATCTYGQTFTAAIQRGNVMATQFHPEKSGEVGLNMLRRFAQWKGDKSC